MAYSFTQIEKDKTRTIGFVFSFLVGFYFLSILFIVLLVSNFVQFQVAANSHSSSFHFIFLDFAKTGMVFGAALIIGFCHWQYTTTTLISKIIKVLQAEPLDPKDTYHQVFQNIIEEVSVATGGQKMQGVVLPTMAMNAFAIADFKGQAIIGVTEGMLARLSRAQLEAVVGHEAAHIVSGDSLITSVTTSLFEMYSGMLEGIAHVLKSTTQASSRGRGRGSGGILVLLVLIYCLLSITKLMSQLLRMFLSREKHYRADAVAVRLTRDPLSLAEALYAIVHHWRGAGLPAEELEAIFIVNPAFLDRDEKTGLLADLFSTHPPLQRRLQILLNMAHSDIQIVVNKVKNMKQKPRVAVPEAKVNSTQWMVNKEGQWQGPFDIVQMMSFGWVQPETWIQRVGGGEASVQMAYQDKDVGVQIAKGKVDGGGVGRDQCPKCRTTLNTVIYEGLEIQKCHCCQGVLLYEKDVQKIIVRQEVGFSPRIVKIAEGVKKESNMIRKGAARGQPRMDAKSLYDCPECTDFKRKMLRVFYSDLYRIEIDKCLYCKRMWFDKDELEILQCLIEDKVNQQRK